jgi:hypothetical protein
LLLWLIVSATSLMGLLGIWAAKSRRHWFVRAAVVACPIALLAAVPAFELVLIFLAEMTTISLPFVGLLIWRARRYHFRLSDLMLAIVVVAAGVLLAKNMPYWLHRVRHLATGAALGYAVLAGYGTATLTRRSWLMAGLILGLALAPFAATHFSWLFLWDAPQWFWFAAIPLAALAIGGCLVLHRLAGAANSGRRVAARLGLAVLLMALVPLPAVTYYQITHPMPIPLRQPPSPNAYVELVRIGENLNKNNPSEFQQPLSEAAQALVHDSLVPVRYVPNDVYLAPHAELRALLRLWTTAGQAAETDGRFDDACKTYLNIIQAGVKARLGGLFIDWSLGSLYVQAGIDGIQRIRWQISDARRREACAELHLSENTLEPIEAPIEREEIYAQHAHGWQARIRFLPIFEFNTEALKRTENRYRAQMRLLEVDLAVRRFQHKHGRPPNRLDELVPDFLPAVPIDPFIERPLIYGRTENGFLLYSTGPDQVDNGGIRASTEAPETGEDLLLMPTSDNNEERA